MKKDIEEAKKKYENDFFMLDIWFITSEEYWEHDPPEEYDAFWERFVFPRKWDLKDHIADNENQDWDEDYSDNCVVLFISRLRYT